MALQMGVRVILCALSQTAYFSEEADEIAFKEWIYILHLKGRQRDLLLMKLTFNSEGSSEDPIWWKLLLLMFQ